MGSISTVPTTWRAILAIVLVGLFAGACASATPAGAGTTSPTPIRTGVSPGVDSGTPTSSASLLPDLAMPGARRSPAGEYGWDGRLGSPTETRAGMHNVVVMPDGGYRQTQMVFAVENDCFASGEGPTPRPTTVAGLDGWYVEPYDGPGVRFILERQRGQTTGGYALPIGDRTLCVYLTWDKTTTTDELAAAREVVESIRGQALGASGIRIVFTLPEGWDIG